MSTIFINSYLQSAWTPAQPTTSGGILPHTWEVPGVANFQDAAKTTPAGVGDVVGAVVNQGSDSHDIAQATTDNKPTLQQVTIGSVTSYVWRFDGTNDYLRGAFGGGAISQPFTVFAVARIDSAAITDSAYHFMFDTNAGGNQVILDKTDGNVMRVYAGAALTGNAPTANPTIWNVLYNGASSVLRENGVIDAGPGNAGASTLSGLTVGARVLGDLPWKGDIGPVLIYRANLSTADKNQIGLYLERVTGIVWTAIP